jgi:hypothetical protein
VQYIGKCTKITAGLWYIKLHSDLSRTRAKVGQFRGNSFGWSSLLSPVLTLLANIFCWEQKAWWWRYESGIPLFVLTLLRDVIIYCPIVAELCYWEFLAFPFIFLFWHNIFIYHNIYYYTFIVLLSTNIRATAWQVLIVKYSQWNLCFMMK